MFRRVASFMAGRMGGHGGLGRSIAVLVGGTAAAQLIMLSAMPILTRTYTPSQFAILAAFVAGVSICSVSACLRLEIAIPIPGDDRDAAALLFAALACSTLVAAATGVVVTSAGPTIVDAIDQEPLEPYLWLLPLSVWLTSSYGALQYWASRKKRYPVVARTRITQATAGAGTQVGVGLTSASTVGLLVGQTISSGAGVVALGLSALRNDRTALSTVSKSRVRKAISEYQKFPKYSALEALINTAGNQAPILIIAVLTVGPEAGYLLIAMRIMQAPTALLGAAAAQVYLSEAPEALRTAALPRLTSRVLKGLASVGAGPLVAIGVLSPFLAGPILGPGWERAGWIILLMTPWTVLQFLSSPISMVMHVRGRQFAMLILTTTGLALRIGAIFIAYAFAPTRITEAFALASAIYYSICLAIFASTAGVNLRMILSALVASRKYLLSWTVVTVAGATVLTLLKP